MNREILLVAAWTLACSFATGMTSGDFFRNEGLRSRVAWTMARDGLTVVPRLDGELLATKPPLVYWLVAVPARWLGDLPLALARWPSVVAFIVIAAGLALVVSHRHGCHAGLGAGLFFPMAIGWLSQVPSAELDMPLTACVAGSWAALALAFDTAKTVRANRWWVAAGAIAGIGFWTKWTAPVFFHAAVLGMALVRRDPWILLGAGHCLAIGAEAVFGLGWLALASREVGFQALIDGVVHREALPHLSPWHHRVGLQPAEWLSYPFQAVGMGFPAIFALFLLLRRDPRREACAATAFQVLLAGSLVSLAFWTLVPGHRPRHSLPAVAGLVMAAGWLGGLALARSGARARTSWLVAACGVWLVATLAFRNGRIQAAMAETAPAHVAKRLEMALPSGATLGVVGLRDDGLLLQLERIGFRVIRRALPNGEAGYWLLTQMEVGEDAGTVPGNWTDQQGAGIVLIRR